MSNPESESPVFKLFGKTIQTDTDEKQPQSASATTAGKVATKTSEEEEEQQQQQETETAAARAAAAGGRALPCPRCKSRDTKFCYFNNYNVNQPRHFCKACHRYWTAGGTLRNVPVGAGRRKNRAPPPTTNPSASVGVAVVDQFLRLAGR